ncbi:ankyrin repeat domain-containing protein [Saccharopolyspora sp. NPDC003752]
MRTEETYEIARRCFEHLGSGDLTGLLRLVDEQITFEIPCNEQNCAIPYVGTHVGRDAMRSALLTAADELRVTSYVLRDLRAQGDVAMATIAEEATHIATGAHVEVGAAHRLVLGGAGKVSSWQVYFDPAGLGAAFRSHRNTLLFQAIRHRDAESVREQLARGADPDHRDVDSGLTALMAAAGRADGATVRLLLAAGADVHAADSAAGATALHKACQGGSPEVVRLLVEAGAQVDATVPGTGHTPLMEALWFKEPEIVRYLLDRGASVNLATHYGFSMAEHLDYEINVNTIGKERLVAADEHIQRWRRDNAAYAEAQPLLDAVAAGDTDRALALIAAGADVEARYPKRNDFNDGHTPLLVATRDGHTEITRALVAAGADANAVEPVFGAVPLHKAVYNGRTDITRELLAVPGILLDFQGATNGYTPLHDALWHGYEECSRALIDAGARLDLEGHDGKRPLDIAVEVFGSDHDLVRELRTESQQY